jgi:histidinol-phosphate phosphatase family protein
VFLDRDSVMTRDIGGVSDPSDLQLLPGAADAIARLNAAGIAAILIGNQPVIATGMMLHTELQRVSAKLDDLLGRKGAYLNDNYCGVPGAVSQQKVTYDVLRRAAQEHVLSLERSIIIADRYVDIEAGRSAGCMTIRVATTMSRAESAPVLPVDRQAQRLQDAVEIALSELGCHALEP